MSVWNAQTSAIMLLGFLNISYAWHGNLAGQVAFPVAVLHLLVQGSGMNPEHRGNESKTSNCQTKASLPARKTCLFLSTNKA